MSLDLFRVIFVLVGNRYMLMYSVLYHQLL